MPTMAPQRSFALADALFLLVCALYAWLCLDGVLALSANGASLDSDLQTYAQGMARVHHPRLFVLDPVLSNPSEANGIPNLQRWLAEALSPPEAWGVGLLRAGACAIFVFYAGWYALGRYLFRFPALAALLSLACGVTVWVGWGTFWGVTHSDPVPRVFFAAVFPILLLFFFVALSRPFWRPVVCLVTGATIWIHGVSALNCGAMFFLAYLFLKPERATLKAHLANCFFCLLAFFAPVLTFLWPSLFRTRSFSDEDLQIFRELFSLRWQRDYSDFWPRLTRFFSPSSQTFPLLIVGLCAFFFDLTNKNPKIRRLCAVIPPFCLALALVALFCRYESLLAYDLGRPPMGHELVRGLKFLPPLCWLLIVAAFAAFAGKTGRGVALAIVATLILVFNADRQYEGAQYSIARHTGLETPLTEKARADASKAESRRRALEAVTKFVPENEAVFATNGDMGVRYVAHRPLVHSFKDGYVHFYNKDAAGAKKWLDFEKALNDDPREAARAIRQSGAKWILRAPDTQGDPFLPATPEWSADGWSLERIARE